MNLSSGVYFVMTDLQDKDGDKSPHALIYNADATLPGSDCRGVLIGNRGILHNVFIDTPRACYATA